MAKYRLLTQHYSEEDKLLEPDTIVGDGTPHVWTRRPTPEMEPLDEEGREALDKERTRAQERGLPWGRIAPIDDLPMTIGEADDKYEREVKEGAAESDRRGMSEADRRALAEAARRPIASTLADNRGRR